jgi:riboflavin kinase/FMN adenylyltransferase
MSDTEKETAFQRLGVDAVWFQQFTMAFAELSPRAFVDDVLKAGLRAVHVVVGFDFRFGQGRAGNTQTLRELLGAHGIGLTVIEAVQDGTEKVSSSAIRKAITHADIQRVNALLGWSYAIEGTVIRGDARGRTIDFPTLNIQLGDQIYPSEGVYCGWLESGDQHLAAVANLGARPTVGDERASQLEVHVMDTDLGDMYDQSVRFVFHSKIRMIQRFDDLNALRHQIGQDVDKAQRALSGASPRVLTLS